MSQLLHLTSTDDRLALSARDGDRLSRNLLYMRHVNMIRNRTIPARRLADKLGASGAPINGEDVEQQCFLIYCRLLQTWDPDQSPFITYLLDTISGAAYMYVRDQQHLRSIRVRLVRSKPQEASYLQEEDSADPNSPPSPDTDLNLVVEDNTQEVLSNDFWDTIVTHLCDDWAFMLRQRFWEDKSIEQIARNTGRSRRTVDRTIQSALAILQEEVHSQWEIR